MRVEGGDDFDILIDAHGRLTPTMALEYCKAVEPYRPFWVEEPIQVEGSNDALEWLSDRTTVPLCMGERNFTKWGFQDIIAKRLVSYLNPDIVHCAAASRSSKRSRPWRRRSTFRSLPTSTYSKVGLTAEIHMGLNCPQQRHPGDGVLRERALQEVHGLDGRPVLRAQVPDRGRFRKVAGHPRSRTRTERGGSPGPPLRTATPRGTQVRGRVGGGQLKSEKSKHSLTG